MQNITLTKLVTIFAVALMLIVPSHSYAFRAPDESISVVTDDSDLAPQSDMKLEPSLFTAPADLPQATTEVKKLHTPPAFKSVLLRNLNQTVSGDTARAAKDFVNNMMKATFSPRGQSRLSNNSAAANLAAAPGSVFEEKRVQRDNQGFTHVRLAQYFKGLPVVGGEIIVHLNSQNAIYQINGQYLPAVTVALEPSIEADAVLQAGLDEHRGKPGLWVSKDPSLVIYGNHLAYHYVLSHEGPEVGQWRYYVDAHTGNILFRYDNIKRACPTASGAPAYVYGYRLDGEDGSFVSTIGWLETGGNYYFYSWDNLWGVYDLDVGDCEQNSSNNWVYLDQPAVSAGYNFEYVQDYVSSVLGRNSFDDGGAFAWANIHLGTNYCNAYWNGSSFNFGDGDGTPYCKPLTVTDIAAHEYGHAITDYTSDLVYAYEPGALNEAYSDIMGTLVEFAYQPDGRGVYPDATPGYSDWLCGEDAWGPAAGDALRDLRDPQRYGQPSYYHGTYWYFGDLDNGGVHTNSGVANHAFYLLAEGAPAGDNDGHPHGEITGIGYVAAGEVAMRANMVYHVPTDQYAQAREHWISAAADLGYPTATVEQVWDAVGVGVDGGESFPSPSTVSLGLDYDAQRGGVWLAAEDGYVYLIDVDAPHSTLQTIDLVGIAVAADGNSDGACVLANGNILLADFNGDLTNIDDYLFEIDPNTNTLINYWPLDGSWNTSTDGTFIDTIIGVEIGPNGNAFVTSAFDNYIYEIALVPGLPGSWSTVAVHSATTVGVVLGIDRINCPNFNGWLVSDWNSTTVALLDESFATVASFPANHDSNTFNSGVTAIAVQDENPMNIWTVDFTTNYIGIFDSGITCGSEGGEGQWVLEAPIPHVFMDTVVVEYNNETFVLAGYGGEGQAYKYNPITDTWTRLADQPSPTVEYPVDGVLGYDGSGNPMIYIFPDTTSAQTNIMAYDINSNSWSTVPLSGGFTARWAADIAYDPDNNLCYISGGAAAPGAGDLNELWVFNPATNTFTQKASFTTPRDFHASCYYNGKIYIAGGYDSTTGPLSSTQVYNIATNTWSAENAELGALPDLWWGMGDALQESKLWLMGGVDGTGALVSRTGYFDLTSGSWVNAADLVEPVYRTEGDVQRGDPYLLAGSSGGFTPTAFNQHYLSPEQPTIDLLAADFGSPGLYTYDGTTWNRINSNNPAVLGAYSGKVVANFPGMGLYEYDGTSWKRINTNTGAQDMVAVGDTLYVDFGTAGLYQYNGSSWSRIVRMDASVLASFDGKLAVNFPGRGLYTYDGGWSRIARNDTAETMIGLGSLLYVEFSNGLWEYNGTSFSRLTRWEVSALATYDGKLAVNFPGHGLYEYDGSWSRINKNDTAQGMCGVGAMLYVDFGGSGLYRYDGSSFQRVSTNNCEDMVAVTIGAAGGDCEDFDDGVADDWVDDGSGLWSVQMVTPSDGEYVTDGNGAALWRYSHYDAEDYSDFTVETEVTRVTGSLVHNTGMAFRSDGTGNNHYHFGIVLDPAYSAYCFHKVVAGSPIAIDCTWQYSAAINTGLGSWNTLKAVCSGSTISLYINDNLIGSYTDTSFSSGKVGAMSYDNQADDEMHYDNACVSLDTSGAGSAVDAKKVRAGTDYFDPTTSLQ